MIENNDGDRVEEYKFPNLNTTNEYISNYTLNGTLKTIEVAGSMTNGSIFVLSSGTNELLYSNINIDNDISYPFVYAVDNTNNSGSPWIKAKRIIDSPIKVVVSGLDNVIQKVVIRYN